MNYRYSLAALFLIATPVSAQDFKREILQRIDVPIGVQHETVVGMAEIAPHGTTGRHTHPGVEIVVVIAGEMDAFVEGAATARLKPGDSFLVPTGKIHEVRTVGDVPAKVMVTWMVEKGKPMAAPAN